MTKCNPLKLRDNNGNHVSLMMTSDSGDIYTIIVIKRKESKKHYAVNN